MRITFCWMTFVFISSATLAQGNFPNKPVRMVAPFPAGGSSDLVGRIIAQGLSETWGQQVIVDNRPGAGGSVGTALVARSPADGYTILLGGLSPTAINLSLYKNPGYYTPRDLTAIVPVASAATMLAIHPGVKANTVQELIALARAKPGALSCGSGGIGTPSHLICEMLKGAVKVDILHVAYKGTGQSVNDLLGGQIQLVFASMPVGYPHAQSGKVRALAVTSSTRTPLAPELPTFAEAGVPGLVFDNWWGMFAPAGTAQPIIDKMALDMTRIVQRAEVKKRYAAMGTDTYIMSHKDFIAFSRAEVTKFAKVVKDAGLLAE